MNIDFFSNVFNENIAQTAIVYKEEEISYAELIQKIAYWQSILSTKSIAPGDIVAINGDFTPNAISILFALIENNNIIVPFNFQQKIKNEKKIEISCASKSISVDANDNVIFNTHENSNSHPFYEKLRAINHPGLVLFTSGTSGEPKAAVHDFINLLEKFKTRKKSLRTLNFLLFDHWGGLNTMFHTLSNGGVVLALNDRHPQAICAFIEKQKIELLPASPTFLNLLIISEAYKNYDLSSLKLITYGTEPMPQFTLEKIKQIFPDVKLQQTYGLIELGVLRSKSKSNDSLWVKIGGEGFQTRVVNGLLEIKAASAMMGYLNAPSPFTEDGWFKTDDQVDVDGEYFKIRGRKTEIINVGGEKVYPAEVENTLLEIPFVKDCVVYGVDNIITGKTVFADVEIKADYDAELARKEMRMYCLGHLSKFKVPSRIIIVKAISYSDRFKKIRKTDG